MEPLQLKERILELVRSEGFAEARVAGAEPLLRAYERARQELEQGHLEGMSWITQDWLARSTDPRRFLSGARAVIVVALPAHAPPPPALPGTPAVTRGRVARYAWGRDYHRTFESRLRRLARRIRTELGAEVRCTVDYGPLLERAFALAAGLGWIGKSTMLLVPGFGPWMLLGALATTLELPPDERLRKSCGTCRRCIVACPTGALSGDGGSVDARLCISYHTIENRGPIPRELRPRFGAWIFGCDLCLEACPVGSTRHEADPDFLAPTFDHAFPPLAELLSLDEAGFRERFRGRPLMRAKRDGLLRNACVALGNVGVPEDLEALERALSDPSPLVRGHAAWGAARIATRHAGTKPELRTRVHDRLCGRLAEETDPYVREELHLALADLAQPAAVT